MSDLDELKKLAILVIQCKTIDNEVSYFSYSVYRLQAVAFQKSHFFWRKKMSISIKFLLNVISLEWRGHIYFRFSS